MILGRPASLWIGLATAIVSAIGATALILGVDPVIVASLTTAWGGVAGAIILLIANQPPAVTIGQTVSVQTPAGQPNVLLQVPDPATLPEGPGAVPEPVDTGGGDVGAH